MAMKSIKLKKDNFSSARGGCSRLLEISCRKCNKKIFEYQKDGPGPLRRMYVDRILTSVTFKPLFCPKCDEMLAYPYIYKKENRKAFKVFQDALIKKVKKLK